MTDTLSWSRNRLLASLSPQSSDILQKELQSCAPERGKVLIEAGDEVEQIYFPQTGMISQLVVTEEGDTIETSNIGREGGLGLNSAFGPRRSLTRANIQIPGLFWNIKASRFRVLSEEHPDIYSMALHYTEVLWAEAQRFTACNALHDATARLCRWLLQSADRVGRDELPLTQEFLAQMLGVRRTTVTLVAQALQSRGLISYKRGKIVILDREGLEGQACECYRLLRHDSLISYLRPEATGEEALPG
jgi:CRP-like cAMP-binding protein